MMVAPSLILAPDKATYINEIQEKYRAIREGRPYQYRQQLKQTAQVRPIFQGPQSTAQQHFSNWNAQIQKIGQESTAILLAQQQYKREQEEKKYLAGLAAAQKQGAPNIGAFSPKKGQNFHKWTEGTTDIGHALPGTKRLARAIESLFGVGTTTYRTYRLKKTGTIYNYSTHSEGRGIDIHASGKKGYQIVRWILQRVGSLGITAIIFNRTIWSARSPNGRPYTRSNPHTDHVHIELTPEAAAYLRI